MSSKNQGEGDYEAARRFNKAEQDFVKRKLGKKKTHKADSFSLLDDDVPDSETTKRLWRPGIEFPNRK